MKCIGIDRPKISCSLSLYPLRHLVSSSPESLCPLLDVSSHNGAPARLFTAAAVAFLSALRDRRGLDDGGDSGGDA